FDGINLRRPASRMRSLGWTRSPLTLSCWGRYGVVAGSLSLARRAKRRTEIVGDEAAAQAWVDRAARVVRAHASAWALRRCRAAGSAETVGDVADDTCLAPFRGRHTDAVSVARTGEVSGRVALIALAGADR